MKQIKLFTIIALIFTSFVFGTCNDGSTANDSGVTKATAKVETGPDRQTVEQKNILERLHRDNLPGSIKHLYIVSAYTGDVLQYSTVRGKVTSGGKRLSPKTVQAGGSNTYGANNYVTLNNTQYTTEEVLDDNGSYGDSGNYLYWFDAQGNYQQYYPSGGTYLQISDRPLRIKKVNFSIEMSVDTLK